MDDIISTRTMLQNISQYIDPQADKIPSLWKKIVSRIKSVDDHKTESSDGYSEEMSLGEKIAQNTHVVDLKKGVLLVEANHSGWIQYLRMYQKFILKGFAMECPNVQVKTLAFRTRGTDLSLFDDYEEQLEESLKKRNEEIKQNEKQIQEFFEKNGDGQENQKVSRKTEINSELKAKFDELYDALEKSNP